jgi:hypothetical protein
LKKDKLVVEGRTNNLDYTVKNTQPGVESDGLDILASNSVKESK